MKNLKTSGTTTWMNLKNTLTQRNQAQKSMCYMIPFI